MKKSTLFIWTVFLLACNTAPKKEENAATTTATESSLKAEEARQIAREAYTYAYPMIDAYRIEYAYFVAKDNTEYKGNWNAIHGMARVFTPADKTVQTPNSDTPYSMLGLDLRSEPIVLTIPKLDKNRYFSVQLVDAYTFNFAYLGTRATGNDGGSYLIAGPNWKGELPKDIKEIIRCETDLALAIYRTQLFNPADIEQVKKIQAQYKIQPLSAFLGITAQQAAAPINFITPLSVASLKTSLQAFNVLNFLLQFCPTHPSETALMERFAKIGVIAGKTFDSTAYSPEIQVAMRQGIADAWGDFAVLKKKVDNKEVNAGDLFGTREYLKNNYAYRMMGAVMGIFGNSREEAMYPAYIVDAKGNPLTGTNKYMLRFGPGELPPVNAFWSITMYEMPASLLVENPINRYLINSPMLPKLKKDKDGGLTIYVQHDSPGKDKESNWLPAPAGSFSMFMRLYGPKEEALNGKWIQPPLTLTQ